MAYTIEKLPGTLSLGEGPHWDEETQSLYFVDIYGKSIHRYNPSTKSYSKAVVGEKTVSFIVPVEDQPDKFVIGNGTELSLITWDGESDKISDSQTLVDVKPEGEFTPQWNDGKVDSSGRLWAGIWYPFNVGQDIQLHPKRGSLYTLKADHTLKKQADNISLTNGLAWNDDLGKFYYIDTIEGVVYQYDYDSENYAVSNQQIIFTLKEHDINGSPDGMTIDADGNLWVAVFGSFRVIKIDPRRPETLLQTIELPAQQITSVAFGGPNLDELYVTSGKILILGSPAPEGPEHGHTYRITGLGVKGLKAYKVKL